MAAASADTCASLRRAVRRDAPLLLLLLHAL
jgi:hypothetical protein